jgi:hypothetical protein
MSLEPGVLDGLEALGDDADDDGDDDEPLPESRPMTVT